MRILPIILILLIVGCKAKKKATERKKEKIEAVADVSRIEKTTSAISMSDITTAKVVEREVETNSTEEIEADSTGTVTVKVVKTDSGYIKTYTGVKNIKVTNDTKEREKVDSTSVKIDSMAINTTNKKDESFIRIKRESKERKTDVEIKSTSTWFWILLAIVVILYISRKRIRRLF